MNPLKQSANLIRDYFAARSRRSRAARRWRVPPPAIVSKPELTLMWLDNRRRSEQMRSMAQRAIYLPLAVMLLSASVLSLLLYYTASSLFGL